MNFLGGTTIFGAFDFKFGVEITSSGDKKLAELRENLAEYCHAQSHKKDFKEIFLLR